MSEIRTAPRATRYRILGRLGQGTFGDVDIALDTVLNRRVALKRVRQELVGNEQVSSRFVREYETLSRLEHQNIVPVYDCGTCSDGRRFFCMRLVEGSSFEKRVEDFHAKQGRRTKAKAFASDEFRQLVDYFIAACHAVAHAHRYRVIHRDIKPANILVGEFDEAFLVDWGMARRVDQADPPYTPTQPSTPLATPPPVPQLPSVATPEVMKTVHGSILGTPAFMSPEQAMGQSEQVDERSDIFSLGTTFYFLLTGKPFFEGITTADVLARAQQGLRVDAAEFNPSIPDELIDIYWQATETNPYDRYASVLQMIHELEAWKSHQFYQPPEPVHPHRERRSKLNRFLSLSVAVVLLIAAIIAGQRYVGPTVDQAWTDSGLTEFLSERTQTTSWGVATESDRASVP